MAEDHVLRKGIIEQPTTDAHDSLALSRHVPGNARPRRKVLVIGLVQPAESGSAHLGQCANADIGDRIKTRHDEVGKEIVLLLDDSVVIPPQPVVDGKARRYTKAILQIKAVAVFKSVARSGARRGVLETTKTASHWLPFKESAQVVEFQPAAEVLLELLLIYAGAAELKADF